MRIRHYGILANRAKREKLALARAALEHPPSPALTQPEPVEAFWLRVASLDIHQCPHCKAERIIVIARSARRPRGHPLGRRHDPCIS